MHFMFIPKSEVLKLLLTINYSLVNTCHAHALLTYSDYLDGLVDFPVTGLNLSSFVLCSDSPEAIYDLFAVANHSNDSKGGHCECTIVIKAIINRVI